MYLFYEERFVGLIRISHGLHECKRTVVGQEIYLFGYVSITKLNSQLIEFHQKKPIWGFYVSKLKIKPFKVSKWSVLILYSKLAFIVSTKRVLKVDH